jgi:hypothetical protein
MIECAKLWTNECVDPVIGDRVNEHFQGEYMNLGGPQYLQIFRTTVHTNQDELADKSWLKKAYDALEHHMWAIDEHLALSHGTIVYRGGSALSSKDQVVGEGSGDTDRGKEPFRIMHGRKSFAEKEGFDPEWRPGLLFLRGRLIKLMKPYGPFDPTTGGEMTFVRHVVWLSEVALGFRDDLRINWNPFHLGDAAITLLDEAEGWKYSKDYL